MADKIKKSYKFSKSFYDDAITQGKWWSKLYFKLLWGGVDDNEIAHRVLSWIPDDFKGRMLDVPVGTAVFTTEKYKRMKQADITCLDKRFWGKGKSCAQVRRLVKHYYLLWS